MAKLGLLVDGTVDLGTVLAVSRLTESAHESLLVGVLGGSVQTSG